MSIDVVKGGWADEQEVKALKAVLFGADSMIPVQSHGCERSQDQQQAQFPLRTLGLRAVSLPNHNCHLLTISHAPGTALLAIPSHVSVIIPILQMMKLRRVSDLLGEGSPRSGFTPGC